MIQGKGRIRTDIFGAEQTYATKSVNLTKEDEDDTIVEAETEKNVSGVRLLLFVGGLDYNVSDYYL